MPTAKANTGFFSDCLSPDLRTKPHAARQSMLPAPRRPLLRTRPALQHIIGAAPFPPGGVAEVDLHPRRGRRGSPSVKARCEARGADAGAVAADGEAVVGLGGVDQGDAALDQLAIRLRGGALTLRVLARPAFGAEDACGSLVYTGSRPTCSSMRSVYS